MMKNLLDEPGKYILTFESECEFSAAVLKRIIINALHNNGIDKCNLTIQSEKDFNNNRVVGGEGTLQPHASLDSLFGEEFSKKLASYRQ